MSVSNKNLSPILFTGGHHNSALVVAQELQKAGYPIVWVGHKFTMTGDKAISAEYKEITDNDIPFFELKTGKFYKKRNPLEFLKIATGFVQAFTYLLKTKPRLIISFGGYLAVPVVIVGWLLRIPSVTHEQTVTAGWANKAIIPFVKKIFLTHKSSLKNYPTKKAVVVGLPIRPGFLEAPKIKTKRKTILITCGKQGSHIINQAVFPIIPKLVEKYKVIHQTGAYITTSDKDRARRIKSSLPKHLQSRYLHKPYFFGKEAVKYLHSAYITISRAGAHTVYELIILNKRNIVIPIPWVSHNEQLENAQLLRRFTATTILEEKSLSPETLLTAIQDISQSKRKERSTLPIIKDATQRIIKELQTYL